MKPFDLKVSFQVIDQRRAKAFVNDQLAGNVRIMKCTDRHTKEQRLRLTFRNSANPFKDVVRMGDQYGICDTTTVAELLDTRSVLAQLIPVVIRNYLRNSDFLWKHNMPHEGPRAEGELPGLNENYTSEAA